MVSLRVVLPDQLDYGLIDRIQAADTPVVMAETGYLFQGTTHRAKLTLLTSAGRHYAAELAAAGIQVEHRTIRDGAHRRPLADHLVEIAGRVGAESLVAVRPGSWSELRELERAARELGIVLHVEEDAHFFSTPDEFARHARGRKSLVMEYFYRELRKRHEVLMDPGPRGLIPAGGTWNFDHDNRASFGKSGPPNPPARFSITPDEITRQAQDDVAEIFPDAPGSDEFSLPVTRDHARAALRDFVANRLEEFGRYQDAMWSRERMLYHSLLSSSLNLKLLNPREVVGAAEAAYRAGAAPLNSVEGFVRQVLGWREFVRGIYYLQGPEYEHSNALDATEPLPSVFWDGKTEMECISDVMGGVLRDGYAHHIERLMVMGLYAMTYGANPNELHRWHLALYIDAFDWVSAPNVIGMSQYADGGLLATKPYAASGNYIHRMSNHCKRCAFDPKVATGERACPFTTLYWDFLARHADRFSSNRRMTFQIKNLDRKSADEMRSIRAAANRHRGEPVRSEHAD